MTPLNGCSTGVSSYYGRSEVVLRYKMGNDVCDMLLFGWRDRWPMNTPSAYPFLFLLPSCCITRPEQGTHMSKELSWVFGEHSCQVGSQPFLNICGFSLKYLLQNSNALINVNGLLCWRSVVIHNDFNIINFPKTSFPVTHKVGNVGNFCIA